jgi:hypothetical protein
MELEDLYESNHDLEDNDEPSTYDAMLYSSTYFPYVSEPLPSYC